MRLLIYGAGVIGSLYASLFSKAGYDTTVYARGKRLEVLREKGLLYQDGSSKNQPKSNRKKHSGGIQRADVRVIDKLEDEDCYDFLFLTVRENQLHAALSELRKNNSPTIVTMVNSLEDYDQWETICGKGRILPAFPGAEGGIENDVLEGALTPWIIQPTTFGEIDGRKSRRVAMLSRILRRAHIPYQVVSDMHAWQLCHLAMVVPIADAYYETNNPQMAGQEKARFLCCSLGYRRYLTVILAMSLCIAMR